MHHLFLPFACLACVSHARRVQFTNEQLAVTASKHINAVRGSQSLVEQSESIGNPWDSPEVQRVLMLLCVMAIGFMLRARFPGKEPYAVQKLLHQFLVPATLFKGVSKEKIEWSHAGYLGGGALLVLATLLSIVLVAYATFGGSSNPGLAKLRRTAILEVSTTASALSVLPFLNEFVGPEAVGLGALVDLPNFMYTLIGMPLLLKAFSEQASPSAGRSGRRLLEALQKMSKDPIMVSLILGVVTATVTEGRGTSALGFAGKAIDALSGAQSPILFLLIGLKLNVQSSNPVICAVLLLAKHGVMLIMTSVVLGIFNPGAKMAKFLVLFSQGAPSVVGLGVMISAIDSGLQGYDSDFAFDLVGVAFPISSFFQCVAGLAGTSYANNVGIIGPIILALAGLLRVVFNRRFQDASSVEIKG